MSNFNDADLFAWVYALTRIEPGDFGTRGQESVLLTDSLHQPIACCCTPRRVSLTDDRSEFTRESFGGI